jgi:hypothetical protein
MRKFVIQSGGITDELYVEQKWRSRFTGEFLGFCDGQKNYLNIGLNFLRSQRSLIPMNFGEVN